MSEANKARGSATVSAGKHTPGPWWVSLNTLGQPEVKALRDGEGANQVGKPHGANIAMGLGDHTEARTRGNEMENARLIAAAPDMLEALEALYDRRTPETMAKARDAMAKAKGTDNAQ